VLPLVPPLVVYPLVPLLVPPLVVLPLLVPPLLLALGLGFVSSLQPKAMSPPSATTEETVKTTTFWLMILPFVRRD
jgi:hypothetical protein